MAKIRCDIKENDINYKIFCDGELLYCGEKDSSIVLNKSGNVHLKIITINEQIPSEKLLVKLLKGFLFVLLSPIILLLMAILPLPSVDNYFLIKKSYDLSIETHDDLLLSFITKNKENKKYIDIELSKNNKICSGETVLSENIEEIKQVKKEVKLILLICLIAGISISLIMIFSGILRQITEILFLGLVVLLVVSLLSVLGYMKLIRK